MRTINRPLSLGFLSLGLSLGFDAVVVLDAVLPAQLSVAVRGPLQELLRVLEPGGSVRGERANLKGLVLGCIEAKFCK